MENQPKPKPNPPEKKPSTMPSVLLWMLFALVGLLLVTMIFGPRPNDPEIAYLELIQLIELYPDVPAPATPGAATAGAASSTTPVVAMPPSAPAATPTGSAPSPIATPSATGPAATASPSQTAGTSAPSVSATPTATGSAAATPRKPLSKTPAYSIEVTSEDSTKRRVRYYDLSDLKVTPMEVTGKVRMEKLDPAGDPEQVTFHTGRFGFENDNGKLMDLLLRKGFYNVRAEGEPHFIKPYIGMFFIVGIMLLFIFIAMRRLNGAGSPMSFGRSRGKMYAQEDIGVTFEEVAGIDEAVEELREVVEFLKSPEKFQRLGARIPKGVLLIGPPGTGKTLLAKAIAGEAGVPFYSLSGSDFVEMFVGVGAARVRDMFQQAEAKSPCIIFIDELDALGKTRGGNIVGGNDEREQTLNALLVEMDGFTSNNGVIVLAATNRPETLDPALLRPGRFDRQVVVDRPDVRGREKILNVHVHGVKLDESVDLKMVAKVTSGLAGADLANLVNEAALLAARKGKSAVGMDEFNEGIDRVTSGLEKKHRVIQADEKQRMAYHEAGHALAAYSLPNTYPVHRVSIIPRGLNALASVIMRPEEDRYMTTHAELESYLQILLAGTMTEEMLFNDVSTGAQNDLERASGIARAMVMDFGMSRLGRVTYRSSNRSPFLASSRDMGADHTISEHTAREIDEEVKRIIEHAVEGVRYILTTRKAALVAVAEKVLEKEVIDGEELKQLVEANSTGPFLMPGTEGRRYTSTAPREVPPVARDLVEDDRSQGQG